VHTRTIFPEQEKHKAADVLLRRGVIKPGDRFASGVENSLPSNGSFNSVAFIFTILGLPDVWKVTIVNRSQNASSEMRNAGFEMRNAGVSPAPLKTSS
jgi:hypothetical protein